MMLSNIAMNDPSSAAWKNSLRREIGQFESITLVRAAGGQPAERAASGAQAHRK